MPYCTDCDAPVSGRDRFCKSCGRALQGGAQGVPLASRNVAHDVAHESDGYVGWSRARESPDGRAYIRSEARKLWRGVRGLLAAPLILGAILGAALQIADVDRMTIGGGLLLGGLADIPLLAIAVRVVCAHYAPAWEGVVIKKTRHPRSTQKWWAMLLFNARTDSQLHPSGNYSETFTIVCKTASGARKRFLRHNDIQFFDYFDIGDRARYFPDTGTFDKYDRVGDKHVYCTLCGEQNPIVNDACEKCGVGLY